MGFIPQISELGDDAPSTPPATDESATRRVQRSRPARRSLWVFGALTLGYLIARDFAPWISDRGYAPLSSLIWFLLACASAALVAFTRDRCCKTLALLCICFLGCGWYTARLLETPSNALDRIILTNSADTDPGTPPWLRPSIPTIVTGIVLDPPQPLVANAADSPLHKFFHTEPSQVFTLETRSLQLDDGSHLPVQGRLRVILPFSAINQLHQLSDKLIPSDVLPQPGSMIRVQGEFRASSPALNPGQSARDLWNRQDRIVGTLHVPSAELIRCVDHPSTLSAFRGWLIGNLESLRSSSRTALHNTLQPDDTPELLIPASSPQSVPDTAQSDKAAQARALLGAMLLGQRDEHLPGISNTFSRLGLSHLVVISGFNMVLLAGMAAFLVRLLGESISGRIQSLTVAAIVILYLLILPAQAPTQRGGIMVLAFIIAHALGRRHDMLSVLGWIALLLAVLEPLNVFSVGYQLSFGIVAGLITLNRRVNDRLFGLRIRGTLQQGLPIGPDTRALRWGILTRRGIRRLIDALRIASASSLLAWAIATPIAAYHVGTFSPLAPVMTVIVTPIFALVLWIGYIGLFITWLIPAAGPAISTLLDFLSSLLVWIVDHLDTLPGSAFPVPALSLGLCVATLLVIIYWLGWADPRRRQPWIAALIITFWLGIELRSSSRLDSDIPLRIDTLAVGDGSCHLLRSADQVLLWDCGSLNPAAGLRLIPDTLRALGTHHIDRAVITHPNLDHYAALADIAQRISLREILTTHNFLDLARNPLPDDAPAENRHSARAASAFVAFMERLGVKFTPIAAGDHLSLGTTRLDILWPDQAQLTQYTISNPAKPIPLNDLSLIARINVPTTAGSRSVLLTGDAGRLALPALMEQTQPELLDVDVLELPHHGSFNAPAQALLLAATPSIVLQSTGPQRALDPRWNILKTSLASSLAPAPLHWWITARDGCISTTISADGTIQTRSLKRR